MRSYLYLLAALCVAVGGAEAGSKELNDYLVDHVKTKDVTANLQAAGEYLKELESAKSSIFQGKNRIKDAKLFVSLQQVVDDSECDLKAMKIILDNQFRDENKDRRVETVIREVFNQHAQRCFKLYPSRFEQLRSQFGESSYKKVTTISDQVMTADQETAQRWDSDMHQHFYDLENIVERYAVGGFSILDPIYNDYLRFAIKENAKASADVIYTDKVLDERTGKSVVHKDKIKDLIKEHLIKPCRDYVIKFADALFVPARVDVQWILSEEDNSDSEFYFGWASFTICRSLIENESKITKNIIDSVSKSNR